LEKLGEDRWLKLRARHLDTGELRFLKKATGPESKQFLENEAVVLTAWSHPHFIQLQGVHQHQEQMVLEFEFRQTPKLRFPLCIEQLCRIMFQLAEVLGAKCHFTAELERITCNCNPRWRVM